MMVLMSGWTLVHNGKTSHERWEEYGMVWAGEAAAAEKEEWAELQQVSSEVPDPSVAFSRSYF